MVVTLDSWQLKRLLEGAAEAGAQKALENLAPRENMLTKSDVMRWMKRIGKKANLIDIMEKHGLVEGKREGKSKNAAIRYKRSDVQTALNAMELMPIVNA